MLNRKQSESYVGTHPSVKVDGRSGIAFMDSLVRLKGLVENGIAPNQKAFDNLDLDDALDCRDSEEFEKEWVRIHNLVSSLYERRKVNIPRAQVKLLDDIQTLSFMKAHEFTNGHEVCGYVSDDFHLISQALILDYDDGWLAGLLSEYVSSNFPHGVIAPVGRSLHIVIEEADQQETRNKTE